MQEIKTKTVPPVVSELSEEEKKVFGVMEWEMGNNYEQVEEKTKISKKSLKKIIFRLKELHLIQVGSLVDINGERGGYFGRGWTLTSFGQSMQNYLEEKYINWEDNL